MVIGKYLSGDEQARLHAAIADAEARSDARFALVVVPVSDRYALFPLLYGAAAGFIVLGALALFWPGLWLRVGFAAAILAFALVSSLCEWLPLRLALVPKHIKRHHARDLAHREFAAHILANRDHKSGVLFFVSLRERYVEIVADAGLHARVGEAAWQALVAAFVAAAKEKRLADGFIRGAQSCADLLAEHAPKIS